MTVEQFTISEVAEMLKISTRTVRRWIKSGRLRATAQPGRGRTATEYRIPITSLEALDYELKKSDHLESDKQ